MLLDELMQAVAFAAQHDDSRRYEVHFVVLVVAPFVETVDPEALVFQVFECLGYVADADYGQVFERSGGGFGYCVGQAGGAAFRDEDCIRTSGVGGANDCAQVVRILYAVEDH